MELLKKRPSAGTGYSFIPVLFLVSSLLPGWAKAQTINITSSPYNASTGSADNAAAIQAAINAVGSGGTVLVPSGTFLSGPLTLKSNMTFQIASGGTLEMTAMGTFPATSNFLYGSGLTNITINGSGTMNGQGAAWWSAFNANSSTTRPNAMIYLSGCNGVTVTGITVKDSPMFHIQFLGNGTNIYASGLSITAAWPSPNTDGIDLRGKNVLIENCYISDGDDLIQLGGSQATDSVTIRNCSFGTGHGLSIGGYTQAGVQNLLVDSCTFNGTQYGIRWKSGRDRGGLNTNLTYSNITMTGILAYPFYLTSWYPNNLPPSSDTAAATTSTTPYWYNITLSNITASVASGAKGPGIFWPVPEAPVSNLVFNAVTVTGPSGITFDVHHGRAVTFNCNCLVDGSHPPTNVGSFDAVIAYPACGPSPTNTPVVATNTPTRTVTPVPPTATFTRTNTPSSTATPVPPTATFTSSPTKTNTPPPPSATFTPNATMTFTSTRTATPVPPTSTFTSTPTKTNTPANTATSTFSLTPVPPTATSSFTSTATFSFTPTNTHTPVPPTFTPTATLTPTKTNTPTSTLTNTLSSTPVPPTNTSTSTASETPSRTNTSIPPSSTPTPVPPTATSTATSFPPTATLTSSPTPSGTDTAVPPTATHTPTAVPPTATPTSTPLTPTSTSTPVLPTSTASPTSTPVPPTMTSTPTLVPPTATDSTTPTNTSVPPTMTDTATPLPSTATFTPVPATSTDSATPSPTATKTATPTATSTSTSTESFTPTKTPTLTPPNTTTSTATHTPVPPTFTSTNSPVPPTATLTSTSTVTETSTPTSVKTATPTATLKPVSTVVIAPNPATGPSVNIFVPLSAASDIRVQIFTISFRKVFEQTFEDVQPGSPIHLELKDREGRPLADGLYYVVLQTNHQRFIQKLMVIR